MRRSDPRITIRIAREDHARLVGLAEQAGVELGTLVRECAVRYAEEVASGGGATIRAPRARRRSSPVEGPGRDTPPSRPGPPEATLERMDVYLAHGLGVDVTVARRKIALGHVTVDGQVWRAWETLPSRPGVVVAVDGQRV